MIGRKYTAPNSNYRYGFNGKENDNEVKGEGNAVDFEGRILDTRLGRWFRTDPKGGLSPDVSTYSYCRNSPNLFMDPDGQLTITITAIYDESTKKYNIVKIQTSGDVDERKVRHVSSISGDYYYTYQYYDEVLLNTITYGTDGKPKSSVTDSRSAGKRYETSSPFYTESIVAAFTNDGVFDDWGGIMWRMGGGQNEETKKSMRTEGMEDITKLMQMIDVVNSRAKEGLDKDQMDKVMDAVKKVTDALGEHFDGDASTFNSNDPAIKQAFDILEKLQADIEAHNQKVQQNGTTGTSAGSNSPSTITKAKTVELTTTGPNKATIRKTSGGDAPDTLIKIKEKKGH